MSPRCVAALLAHLAVCAAQAQVPRLGECTIQIGNTAIKPTSRPAAYRAEYAVGNRVIWVSGTTVGEDAGEHPWSVGSRDRRSLRWMAADRERAYLIGVSSEKRGRPADRYDARPHVRVLDLSTGKWNADLDLGESPETGRAEAVLGVLPLEDRVLVLSATVVDLPSSYETDGDLVDYRVTCFEKDKGKAWSVPFKTSGLTRQRPTAFLLSSTSPTATEPDVRPLTAMGKDVLVCAGSQEAIICLDASNGAQRWKVERPWEFERGFIGPSVWSHHIARFGNERLMFEDDEPDKLTEPRAEFDKRYTCSIVGGPVVIQAPADPEWPAGGPDYRFFLAVARAERGQWPQYLSECRVYEFSGNGLPMAVAPMPMMVRGRHAAVTGSRVVWACQDDAMVCIGPSSRRFGMFGGPGGPDCVLRVPWMRQSAEPEVNAWMRTGKAGDPVAFGQGLALRLAGGGYEVQREDSAMHFPLLILDLGAGLEKLGQIVIPHDGPIHAPESNVTRSGQPGRERYRTDGPMYYAVTWLEVVGDRLRVAAAVEGSEEGMFLDFNLTEVAAAVR